MDSDKGKLPSQHGFGGHVLLERNNERENIYNNDPDYKEQVKKRELDRYYRMDEAKLNAPISVS
jgi:hypothetical protein